MAGIDEAGRGPLAGPVLRAAVILDEARPIAGLADSKTLSVKQRAVLAGRIEAHAVAWALGRAEIDALDILEASLLAMRRAVLALPVAPAQVWVDGGAGVPMCRILRSPWSRGPARASNQRGLHSGESGA